MPDFMYYFAGERFKLDDNKRKYGQTKGTGISEKELFEFLESYGNKSFSDKIDNNLDYQEDIEKQKKNKTLIKKK